MREADKYGTRNAGAPESTSSSGVEYGACFDLRISFDAIAPDDSFGVTLPYGYASLNVRELLCRVFSPDEDEQRNVIDSLDVRRNPDLPDMYLALHDIIDEWRSGHSTLRFLGGNGQQIEVDSPVSDHVRRPSSSNGGNTANPTLDLSITRDYDVLAKHAEQGGDSAALLHWMKGCVLLYFMDKHRYRPPLDSTERDWHLEFAVEDLRTKGLIAPNREATAYVITRAGRRFIGHLIAETESYIKHFDVFKDVEYDAELEVVRFGTGRGDDLRVQVFETEGIDPIRAVFLLRLYDRTLDGYRETWLDNVRTDDFFNEVLRPVLDHDRADDSLIDWIIEWGYTHNEEQRELARERASQRDVVRRLRSY